MAGTWVFMERKTCTARRRAGPTVVVAVVVLRIVRFSRNVVSWKVATLLQTCSPNEVTEPQVCLEIPSFGTRIVSARSVFGPRLAFSRSHFKLCLDTSGAISNSLLLYAKRIIDRNYFRRMARGGKLTPKMESRNGRKALVGEVVTKKYIHEYIRANSKRRKKVMGKREDFYKREKKKGDGTRLRKRLC